MGAGGPSTRAAASARTAGHGGEPGTERPAGGRGARTAGRAGSGHDGRDGRASPRAPRRADTAREDRRDGARGHGRAHERADRRRRNEPGRYVGERPAREHTRGRGGAGDSRAHRPGRCPRRSAASAGGQAARGAVAVGGAGPVSRRAGTAAMSNTLAIAAVTATIKDILGAVAQPLPGDPTPDSDLADAFCSARPPDKARTSEDVNQLNLFLYQTVPNAALRNGYNSPQVRPGEQGFSPLAVNLHYLLTAYGRNFDELLSHRLLGRAMSLLHDHVILFPANIKHALSGGLAGADLANQIEHVRITPRTVSTEESSKLWTMFQTPYRMSTAYEAQVVLIDSQHRTTAGLPVIKRGVKNTGNDAVPSLIPPFPALDAIHFVTATQPAAHVSDAAHGLAAEPISFAGHDLGGTSLAVSFQHRLFDAPTVSLPSWLSATSSTGFTVTPPDAPNAWPAGLYRTWATVVDASANSRDTNVIPLQIAPRIYDVQPPSPPAIPRAGDGSVTLSVFVSPPEQTRLHA